uniref:NB-ARC domain-containing protein n=1 Tax=Fagus sylvatica TaxID=28930 RepID=A0A2N9HAA4_FAGSY
MAKGLKVLNLSGCSGLTKSPDFSTLTALEILNLSMHATVEIHPSVLKLKNLRVLDISSTRRNNTISKFPNEIGNLEKLEEIDASNSKDLHGEIPSSIGRLSSLRILRLNRTNICSLPTSICGLSRLETLDLTCCDKLHSLPYELPSSLTSLCVTCRSMETFPSRLSNLINLKNLVFIYCVNLVEIPRDIGKLSQLETLALSSCYKLRTLPTDIGKLSQLETLVLSFCDKLRTLPTEIGAISRLKDLELFKCNNLQCILALPPEVTNTRYSGMREAYRDSRLWEIRIVDVIDYIVIVNSLERLPDVSNLGMLKDLKLDRCQKLVEIEGLGGLNSLEALDVSGCTSLERLDLLSLKNLKKLRICDCKNLTEIQGLEEVESLGLLNMAGCKLIEKLPDLSNLKKLKILIAFFCEKLTEIRGLEELKSLKLLDISGCKSIERLPDLSNTRIETNSTWAKYYEANGWRDLLSAQESGR